MANIMFTAPLPTHWDAWDSTEKAHTVKYVVLPLPAGKLKKLSVLLGYFLYVFAPLTIIFGFSLLASHRISGLQKCLQKCLRFQTGTAQSYPDSSILVQTRCCANVSCCQHWWHHCFGCNVKLLRTLLKVASDLATLIGIKATQGQLTIPVPTVYHPASAPCFHPFRSNAVLLSE